MEIMYVPKGRTLYYESLSCTDIIVDGTLIVEKALSAAHISGKGHVDAGSVSARSLSVRSVDSSVIVLETLAAERVCAAEVKVSGDAMVSCYLEAQYMKADTLAVAGFQVGELHVRELEHLPKKRQGILKALLGSLFRRFVSFLERLIPRNAEYVQMEAETPAVSQEPEEDLHNDFEFLRLKSMYRLLKHEGQGYTLRIVPRDDSGEARLSQNAA